MSTIVFCYKLYLSKYSGIMKNKYIYLLVLIFIINIFVLHTENIDWSGMINLMEGYLVEFIL